MIKSYLQKHKW